MEAEKRAKIAVADFINLRFDPNDVYPVKITPDQIDMIDLRAGFNTFSAVCIVNGSYGRLYSVTHSFEECITAVQSYQYRAGHAFTAESDTHTLDD